MLEFNKRTPYVFLDPLPRVTIIFVIFEKVFLIPIFSQIVSKYVIHNASNNMMGVYEPIG